ncbi:MAG: CRISPR-associated helicase Cas3', partial [Candidatus Korarchaeota archaeon]
AEKKILVEYGLHDTHAFLGLIIFTTWDTFLYGLAAHKTIGNRFTLPAGAIAESLLIFDEVQMYQDKSMYMPKLIGLVLDLLSKANVPTIIMSATIPDILKEIIAGNSRHLTVYNNDSRKPSRGEITVISIEEGDSEKLGKVIIEKVRAALEKNVKILIVRNTVRNAISTYNAIKKKFGDKKIMLLHSRFTIADREKKEKDIEKSEIIVATQVVESGLDMPNVGLVITDIAPIDALIQRIGRCARRKDEKGEAVILIEDSTGTSKNSGVEKCKGFQEVLSKFGFSEENVKAHVVSKREGTYVEVYEEDKKSKKGENVKQVTTSYPFAPYDPLVLMRTYDKLNMLSQCIYDLNTAREALNYVYKFIDYSIVPRELSITWIYFQKLNLFSLPPDYEIKARPALYAMLYAGDTTHFDSRKVIMIDYKLLTAHKNLIEINGEIKELTYVIDEESKKAKPEFQKTYKLLPCRIYLLSPSVYNNETGIDISEEKAEETEEEAEEGEEGDQDE